MFLIDNTLIDWSRAQFALTAIYHWLFVPLTLGLGVIMAIAETKYYKSGDLMWKETAKYWQKLFGINFAIGVATGLILEFEFGTNWSNYSWLVGDIFGAPLAIEGILAFFMEATFIAVMFFGWDKVSKRFHLTSTWLTIVGATISAWWILVANSWMQYPAGMDFNPDTLRTEMTDFFAVAFSPVAVVKFFHTVISSWVLGSIVALAISCWYLVKDRHHRMAVESIKISSKLGLLAIILAILTGDLAGNQVAKHQPMKLAAMENHYVGSNGVSLSVIGMVNPDKDDYADATPPYIFNIGVPRMLSFLSNRDFNSFVPGIKDLLDGGYTTQDGKTALSAHEKIERGKLAITSLAQYRQNPDKNSPEAKEALKTLEDNFDYFGYGYIKNPTDLVPNVSLLYYSFRVMVGLSFVFLLVFAWALYSLRKEERYRDFYKQRWFHIVAIVCVPLVYICSQAGWVVAEMGRQPWAIQDILPVHVAVSKLPASAVQTTFFIFLILFTVLLIAELSIMFKAIKQGPNLPTDRRDERVIRVENSDL